MKSISPLDVLIAEESMSFKEKRKELKKLLSLLETNVRALRLNRQENEAKFVARLRQRKKNAILKITQDWRIKKLERTSVFHLNLESIYDKITATENYLKEIEQD